MTNPRDREPTEPRPDHDEIDEASEESFPASDPPSWTPSHEGAPDRKPGNQRGEPDRSERGDPARS